MESPAFKEPVTSLAYSQNPVTEPLLSQMNPGHILKPYLFKLHFNINFSYLGTMLQAERSRDQVPMRSLDSSIDLTLTEMSTRNLPGG
jgi:hypothetical protein